MINLIEDVEFNKHESSCSRFIDFWGKRFMGKSPWMMLIMGPTDRSDAMKKIASALSSSTDQCLVPISNRPKCTALEA